MPLDAAQVQAWVADPSANHGLLFYVPTDPAYSTCWLSIQAFPQLNIVYA